ncbi:MAG: N-acetyltransferase, partial [Candidatus Solibacter sp.]|nr:N-acetyltransferase [Candidatus Solibacter sp.]
MTPALTPDTLDRALAFMSAFYAEEALDFREPRARHALEQLLADPALGVFRFIEKDGEPVGYFVLTLGFSLEFAGCFALLDEFYVAPAHRGHGIGGEALIEIQRIAASLGVAALRLEVDRANPRVHAFYQRAGFVA